VSVRLYMDVHIPLVITEGLRRRGLDVLTAQQDGADRLDDDLLLQRATTLHRALSSQDEDLLAIAAACQLENDDFSGLIYAHQLGPGIGEIVEDLELLCVCSAAQEIRNRIIFLPLR
jgi:hypothetical protein